MDRQPDFIIIGAMKAATSTLQQQLASQPGIFMTQPKEPNFFSDDENYNKGMDWYRGLYFSAREGDLLGEASTHYTKLPTYPFCVERIKKHLPASRFVYVMRHPIDRLISHYIHEWSMGVFKCGIDVAVDRYPELVSYGKYSEQLEPFFEAFGMEAVLPVFFDRLLQSPQGELGRICEFIGYKGEPQWLFNLEADNVSSQRIRRFPMYDVLVDSTIATWFRRRFIPQSLRDSIKSRLIMSHRPEISERKRQQLVAIFDSDLARLGELFGVNINCSNFKQLTTDRSLNWNNRKTDMIK